MKNEKKWTPHIIAAAALAVFVVLGLACATLKPEGTSTYWIFRQAAAKEKGFLKGKKAVIFNITMADRGKAAVAASSGGGIFSAVTNVARLSRAAAFNNTAKKFDKENEADLKEILRMFDELVAAAWQKAYDAETVQTAYNFGKTNPKINYFNKANKEIARICAENNAEFAVTIIQQIDHGYLDESVLGMGKMAAITFIVANINVFDKKGGIVLSATAKLPDVTSNEEAGYKFSPNDGEQYAQLYLNNLGNIFAAIMAFDTSAAFSIDELLEGIEIKLATTEEVGEDE